MLGKLALRNVKRSVKDYLVYVITMMLLTALMFAFNSVLFSPDIRKRFDTVGIMAAMIGLATFFIVIIVAWLINYMIRFMLNKRSREFGTYLLLGIKKKELSRLYMCENIIMGTGAFLAGMALGILLQQLIMAVLYTMLQDNYHLKLEFNRWCILMTVSCYAGCYLLALFRCKRRFKKMNIRDLMDAGNKNEEVKESHERIKQWMLPLSVLFLALFDVWLFFGGKLFGGWNGGTIIGFLVGLVLVIYLFYIGLSSFMICYIRRGGKRIYQGQNLFLLRQLSSKIKTMWFTMGTLTSLFTIAFLGCTVAMMFSDYQNRVLQDKFPFDVQMYSPDVEDDFADEIEVLKEQTEVNKTYSYYIYENGTNQVNVWLRTHLRCFGTMYKAGGRENGEADLKKIEETDDGSYCRYDTYMKLSDYNYLREMLGYGNISLKDDEYAVHIKKRVLKEAGDFAGDLHVEGEDGKLTFSGYHTEPFSQDGHNGGDYVIVVPDANAEGLRPYYAELVAELKGEAPQGLMDRLDELAGGDIYGHLDMDSDEEEKPLPNSCYGSDQIITYAAVNLVRDNLIPEIKYMLSSIVFPCLYTGFVFVCVALTVLSVQQLSDSAKYKFRYDVLRKIGLKKGEVAGVIRRQLVGYYLCPAVFAAGIAGIVAVFISGKFIFYTGTEAPVFQYFGMSFLLFFGIYTLYFFTTYLSFQRNVENGH